MSAVTPQNISSTFVVLDDANNAIPLPVGDRFYEKLEQQFGDFKGKRLISYYTLFKIFHLELLVLGYFLPMCRFRN